MNRGFLLSVSLFLLIFAACPGKRSFAQEPLTWQQVRARFIASNPTLLAARMGIEEARAQEITASLRPNPTFTALLDQIQPYKSSGAFTDSLPAISVDYLIERMNKRGLRMESSRKGTAIVTSQVADQERTLLFTLRSAFIQVLQQKAILDLARENLEYDDRVLDLSAERLRTGDIAQIDLDRLQLQRVQFESDVQTAAVNLRTAKIQLLTLLNDRTPLERFDVTGRFDFSVEVRSLEELRAAALETRPDLKAALQSVDQAMTNQRLAEEDASTDPTVGIDFGRNPPITSYMGLSVSFPLRIFDRNQGERLRTKFDITRNERVRDAIISQAYGDVDSAYATLTSTLVLLKPYKERYLQQAVTVRDTMTFSYQRGGASLLDFLGAQRDYRSVRIGYLNLVGAYLSAAAQVDFAVGREVIE